MVRFFAAALLMILAAAARADDSPISTDRPAVTESSVVVPAGTLQFENGFLYSVSQGEETLDGPETEVRFGLLSKTELRLFVPDYFAPLESGVLSGFGDLGVGVKQQLGPVAGFDVSVILSLSLPTGARGISSGRYDPSVQLPWSRALSSNWTAAGMFSVYGLTEDGRRDVTGETTFLIDRQLTKTADAFVEYAGDFPQRGGPSHLLHAGAAFRPTPHQQLDVHVGVGLSRAAADHFIGFGYSFRFSVLPH
jgi:hypothetical protein